MATTKIFSHQNTQGINITFYTGTTSFVSGLCCGYSIAWAKKLLLGYDPANTVPLYSTARTLTTVMSGFCNVHLNSTEDMVANTADYHFLRVVSRSTPKSGWDLIEFENHAYNCVYLLCTGNHVVAFSRTITNSYYYFDSNTGLYLCDDLLDLSAHLSAEPNIAAWLHNQSFMLQVVRR
jgi:hypothetical protein